jgi:hypothetical protein
MLPHSSCSLHPRFQPTRPAWFRMLRLPLPWLLMRWPFARPREEQAADNARWTTMVARMKEKCANLTDEQVPVVVEFLNRAAGTLTVAPAGGGGKAELAAAEAAGAVAEARRSHSRREALQWLVPTISKCSRRRTSKSRCRTLLRARSRLRTLPPFEGLVARYESRKR